MRRLWRNLGTWWNVREVRGYDPAPSLSGDRLYLHVLTYRRFKGSLDIVVSREDLVTLHDMLGELLADEVSTPVLASLAAEWDNPEDAVYDEPEVIEVTPLEYEQAVQALLGDIGYTREQLAEQARCRSFASLRARQAWLLIGPVPKMLFPAAEPDEGS